MLKRTFILLIIAGSHLLAAKAQSLSPVVIPASGGYSVNGGNSLSSTMGEPFYKTLQSGNVILTQGFQQPYMELRILNLKVFLEGIYMGGRQMVAALHNMYPNLYAEGISDSITVELHDALLPDNLAASRTVLLHTDGSAIARFPSSVKNNSYYVVIRHRNSLTTWSKFPVLFNSATTEVDFTTP